MTKRQTTERLNRGTRHDSKTMRFRRLLRRALIFSTPAEKLDCFPPRELSATQRLRALPSYCREGNLDAVQYVLQDNSTDVQQRHLLLCLLVSDFYRQNGVFRHLVRRCGDSYVLPYLSLIGPRLWAAKGRRRVVERLRQSPKRNRAPMDAAVLHALCKNDAHRVLRLVNYFGGSLLYYENMYCEFVQRHRRQAPPREDYLEMLAHCVGVQDPAVSVKQTTLDKLEW